MDNVRFKKTLTVSERQRHLIRLPPRLFKKEIEAGHIEIQIDGFKTAKYYIDPYGRLLLGSIVFNPMDLDVCGTIIELVKIDESKYQLFKKW